jgi:hypothetical protein
VTRTASVTGDAGLLVDPDVRLLERFDAWAADRVDEVAVAHRHLIGTYLRWGLRRRLGQAAAAGVLRPWSTRGARQQLRLAIEFLAWLDTRTTTLTNCTQTDLDHWFSTGTSTRQHTKNFLVWAIRNRHCDRRLRIPDIKAPAPTPMPATQHRTLITRLFHDREIPLADRVAGLLMVLYAQPASRIARIRVDHLTITNHTTHLDIGGNPIELVEPLGELAANLAHQPRTSPWLFTGHHRQPVNPKTISERLTRLGITRAARIAGLHELIREIPSPVLGPLIGYNPNFIAERAATLATPYATYPHHRQRT